MFHTCNAPHGGSAGVYARPGGRRGLVHVGSLRHMADELLEELHTLERRGWDALCDGTADAFYGELMTEDGLMVLANGQVMTRLEVAAALRDAPTWDGYEIDAPRLVTAGQESAALVYRARALRDGQPPFEALMTSLYVQVMGRWRLGLYTQTPIPDGRA